MAAGNTANSGSELHVREVFRGEFCCRGQLQSIGYRGLTNAEAFNRFTANATDITATSNGNEPTAVSRILTTSLADRGGPTQTHAVMAASPAVDAINDGTCPPPAKDQRGVRRPQDGNGDGEPACDIESFERQ